ncbi:MAG: hypothetical protein EU529_07940 [Promethearchaeota archaeon]|nr:MAG: hypothetical protein EU529_07940 [Candidatus Lokiarchaeota archaeon]
MLTKTKKYFILIVIDVLISAFIWHVNSSWGNTCWTCLILSITTFLIIFTPFQIYFSLREIYFDRWKSLHLEAIKKSKVKINVEGGYLYADLIISRNQEAVSLKNTIVIISPGFSDTKETLQYYYFPLVYHGYVILTYDARGMGRSKKTGKRSDFIKRIEDFKTIIKWLRNHDKFKNFKINCIGISIGALTVFCGGFSNKKIEKIVAISSISKYRENIKISKRIVKFSYLMKGINLKPNDEVNEQLSPYLIIKNLKNDFSQEEWKKFTNRVFLIHSRNDRIIPFKNFEENREILELSAENQLIMNKGRHIYKKDELAIVGAILKFLNK